jgi:hypothetical protein
VHIVLAIPESNTFDSVVLSIYDQTSVLTGCAPTDTVLIVFPARGGSGVPHGFEVAFNYSSTRAAFVSSQRSSSRTLTSFFRHVWPIAVRG